MKWQNDLDFAKALDNDNTISFRDQFNIPQHNGKDAIYFLGNSLGLQPKRTSNYIGNVLEQWKNYGVEGFFKGEDPWLQYHDELIQPLANIVGALPEEIVVMNSLTVNLHLLFVSFYKPTGKKNKILCESKAFCSDQYMLHSHVRQRGLNPDDIIIEVETRPGEACIKEEDLYDLIEKYKDELALIFIGGVNYYTGQLFDMETITKAGHAVNAVVGFDLAHAAGNVHLQLHDWDVDFASWCSYKYLNSGPGAIGGAYVNERFHNDFKWDRFAGWWGYKKETRFKMEKKFIPIDSAEGWALSTPSPILYSSHKAALELFDEAGFERLVIKGQALSDYLIFLLKNMDHEGSSSQLKILTPEDAKGCQVSILMLENGKEVFEDITAAGIYADWREPNVIRVAPVPLYNTFEEIWLFYDRLKNAI